MRFYKYCGAGNDFVLVENFDGALASAHYSELARRLCDRHFSVGADGLMILEPPTDGGDCKLAFFNNDGSSAEMCGNGARCVCRHCCDFGLSGDEQRIETAAGLVTGRRISEENYRIRLNDPTAFRPLPRDLMSTSGATVGEKAASPTFRPLEYMELGENGIPHGVVLVDMSEDRAILRDFARELRRHPAFPKGMNVNLCAVTAENTVRLLTYERGVEDFTLACGTGNGAAVCALSRAGLVSGRATRVVNDGGIMTVDVTPDGLYLTGPALRTFVGELPERGG